MSYVKALCEKYCCGEAETWQRKNNVVEDFLALLSISMAMRMIKSNLAISLCGRVVRTRALRSGDPGFKTAF